MNTFLSFLATLAGRLQRPQLGSPQPLAAVMAYEVQSFPETLAKIAESQVGVVEVGGNNRGPQIQAYQSATWLAGTGWKWCAAFVCWVVWQALQKTGITPDEWKRPRTAGAWDLEEWAWGNKPHARNLKWTCFKSTPTTPPRRGDICTFTWAHVGIVTGYDPKTKLVYTVEGNAGASDTSDSSADGVKAKKQHVTKIRRLIRYHG